MFVVFVVCLLVLLFVFLVCCWCLLIVVVSSVFVCLLVCVVGCVFVVGCFCVVLLLLLFRGCLCGVFVVCLCLFFVQGEPWPDLQTCATRAQIPHGELQVATPEVLLLLHGRRLDQNSGMLIGCIRIDRWDSVARSH